MRRDINVERAVREARADAVAKWKRRRRGAIRRAVAGLQKPTVPPERRAATLRFHISRAMQVEAVARYWARSNPQPLAALRVIVEGVAGPCPCGCRRE